MIPQLLLFWITPESPRWLIAKKKWKPLSKLMKNCLKLNKARLPPTLVVPEANERIRSRRLTECMYEEPPVMRAVDMFANKVLRSRSLIMLLNWGSVSLVYYGISMTFTLLGGNIFVNFIMGAVAEMCGLFWNVWISDIWGRKPTIILG